MLKTPLMPMKSLIFSSSSRMAARKFWRSSGFVRAAAASAARYASQMASQACPPKVLRGPYFA